VPHVRLCGGFTARAVVRCGITVHQYVPKLAADGTFMADTVDARLLNLSIPPSATSLFDLRKQ
jgi:hypothetical protein